MFIVIDEMADGIESAGDARESLTRLVRAPSFGMTPLKENNLTHLLFVDI